MRGNDQGFVEPAVRPELLQAAKGPGGEVIVSVIEGPGLGTALRVSEDGSIDGELPAGWIGQRCSRQLSAR